MTGGMTPESPRDLASAKLRLDALVDWERRARSGMRPQLEPVRDLCQRLGDPHTRWRCVHVTGTKGKGSTAHLVATALQKAGWRTGLYTSPHVERVQERIRIHGAEVGDEVMTTSGLYGFVTGFDGDIAWIEIDDNVQIRVARQAIQRKVDTSKGETATPSDDGTKSRHTKIDDVSSSDAADES